MTTTALAPGIHYGVRSADYHAWKLDKAHLKDGPISCSMLKNFALNPYAWLKSPENQQTDAMRIGSLIDAALTEPERLKTECIISPYDSFRTKDAKAWKLEHAGKLIVTGDELERAMLAAERVREHAEAGPIIAASDFQVAVVGEVGSIPAKCLIDILPKEDAWDETIWDFKTTTGLDDESIRRTIGAFKYPWQAGFYRTLFNKTCPDRHCERFGFIFQDRDTLEVRVVILHEDDMGRGTRAVGKAAKEFVTCAERGIRSRYRKGITEIQVLPYIAMNEEEWIES